MIQLGFYKNNLLKFLNLKDRYDLYLFDSIGKEVVNKEGSNLDQELFLQVESGIYFYSLLKNGVGVYKGKLAVF